MTESGLDKLRVGLSYLEWVSVTESGFELLKVGLSY